MLLPSRREFFYFEITIYKSRSNFIDNGSLSLYQGVGISNFRANLNSHEANADAAVPQARYF